MLGKELLFQQAVAGCKVLGAGKSKWLVAECKVLNAGN